jgi:2-polyprenyl-3-methyl-5-hydroxy-6-metoxy-1,4-benzoquinol methylase
MEKPLKYYSNERNETLEFIPKNSKKILEVGCAEGNFGLLLKKEFNSEVWGIEPAEAPFLIAKEKIDKIFFGTVEENLENLPELYFDVIVFNDVLEHLYDPYFVLKEIKNKISETGCIVASIPNVRFWGNLKEIINKKDWHYKNKGILDFTHIRFFTKISMIRMFEDAGFKVEKIKGVNPTKSKNYKLVNFFFFGYISDARYSQYVLNVIKKS